MDFTHRNSTVPSRFLHIEVTNRAKKIIKIYHATICVADIMNFRCAASLLTLPGLEHEVSLHRLVICPKLVLSDERVVAVVEVGGAVQLQAAVVFSISHVMDQRHNVVPLRHRFVIQEPLQIRLWVSW